MALLQATLKAELLKLFNPDHPNFVGWPATPAEVGQAWAAAYQVYASTATDFSLDSLLVANQAGFASTLTANLPLGTVGTPTVAAQAFDLAFSSYWMGATFGLVCLIPPFASEASSVVTVVTPGVLQGLLEALFAVWNTDVDVAADAIATAFHAATTSAVTVLISGLNGGGSPISATGTLL